VALNVLFVGYTRVNTLRGPRLLLLDLALALLSSQEALVDLDCSQQNYYLSWVLYMLFWFQEVGSPRAMLGNILTQGYQISFVKEMGNVCRLNVAICERRLK
jgi:hypothetical protein